MGIPASNMKFMFYSTKLGASFKKTLTLGRQFVSFEKHDIQKVIEHFNFECHKKMESVVFDKQYAEPLFQLLGAETVDSLDYSDYEGATVIHDLNYPIPEKLKSKYTAIIDAGTSEHIFNFPVAIKSYMDALEIGGHYIGFIPANNDCGHGFYQFSPELFYRIFDESNGFKVKVIAVHVQNSVHLYKIEDPAKTKCRIRFSNSFPVELIILAEKISDRAVFSICPQQSEFAFAWDDAGLTKDALSTQPKNNLKTLIRNSLVFTYRKSPSFIAKNINMVLLVIRKKRQTIKSICKINKFEKIEM